MICAWAQAAVSMSTTAGRQASDRQVLYFVICLIMWPSHHHRHWVLDQRLEGADKLSAERAIDRAMVRRERDRHHPGGFDLAVLDDCALFARPHRQDGRVRRVDTGGEIFDAIHAEV